MNDIEAIRRRIAQYQVRLLPKGGHLDYRHHRKAAGGYEIIAYLDGREVGRSDIAEVDDTEIEFQAAILRALQSAFDKHE